MTCDIAELSAEADVRIQLFSIQPGVKNSSEIEHVLVTQSSLTSGMQTAEPVQSISLCICYMLSVQ